MLVSLYKAKLHLRASGDDEDAIISLYLSAAEDAAQQFLGRKVYAGAVPVADLTGISLNASVEAAVLLMVGSLYAMRENEVIGLSVAQLPMGAHALMQPYRCGMGV
jgi:hypothetical protein